MMMNQYLRYIHSTESFSFCRRTRYPFVTSARSCRMRWEFVITQILGIVGGGHPITSQRITRSSVAISCILGT